MIGPGIVTALGVPHRSIVSSRDDLCEMLPAYFHQAITPKGHRVQFSELSASSRSAILLKWSS